MPRNNVLEVPSSHPMYKWLKLLKYVELTYEDISLKAGYYKGKVSNLIKTLSEPKIHTIFRISRVMGLSDGETGSILGDCVTAFGVKVKPPSEHYMKGYAETQNYKVINIYFPLWVKEVQSKNVSVSEIEYRTGLCEYQVRTTLNTLSMSNIAVVFAISRSVGITDERTGELCGRGIENLPEQPKPEVIKKVKKKVRGKG